VTTSHPQCDRRRHPPLTAAQILRWADAHRQRTGRWPTAGSGPVGAGAAETWLAVNSALRCGFRGLPGGDSLSRLLRRAHGLPERRGRRPDPARRRQAARLRAGGLTLAEIGRRLAVSRQRVAQLLQELAKGC
jgi:hypothetical protein